VTLVGTVRYGGDFDSQVTVGSGMCVLQYVAVCHSVSQCFAVCCSASYGWLWCVCVLQCVAVCCSVLQCVAVCRSALQRVAATFMGATSTRK